MARLAAYYQEDFHYPSAGPGHKQRKSAYIVYDEPKNNLFNNRDRIRGLTASEPRLDLPLRTSMLKQRVPAHGSHFENVCNTPTSNHLYAAYEPEVFDNESSYCEIPQTHINQYNQRCKSRVRKRFSYAEPSDLHSPEMLYIPSNIGRYHTKQSLEDLNFRNYINRLYHQDNYYVEEIGHDPCPPVIFRSSSQQGNWQQYPWTPSNANPAFLSPPSPLDSGLSSQSIGSIPSLDAELCSELFPVTRSGRHSACSCPKVGYCEMTRLRTQDSGSTSPGLYPVSHHSVKLPPRHKRISKKGVECIADDYNNVGQPCSQVRYGKLGLIGEPTYNVQRVEDIVDRRLDNFNKQQEYDNRERIHCVYTDKNGIPLHRIPSRRRCSKLPSDNYTRSCVIILDNPPKTECPSSPEQGEQSDDKSQGSESPMSVTVSGSVTSSTSSNELDEPRNTRQGTLTRQPDTTHPRPYSDKTAEIEIRELEDMYERCNLGDRDLLDRAERRDLPTAHQESHHRLTRSHSSDALCETLHHNPYELFRRAPPRRRSGMPDRIEDDMAIRKLHKPTPRSSAFNPTENTGTYMLCSAHFTPTVPPAGRDFLLMGNPDVELDDLCYRRHYLGKEGRLRDTQPPFGIPLRPPPTQRGNINDYLHIVPSGSPQPICHPRGNPDIVRDDMAFRTLRKDEPDRMHYGITQVYKNKKG